MFWYIIGAAAAVVSLLALWANAGAFGMQDDDTPQSEYEKRLGLGAVPKDKETGKQATQLCAGKREIP